MISHDFWQMFWHGEKLIAPRTGIEYGEYCVIQVMGTSNAVFKQQSPSDDAMNDIHCLWVYWWSFITCWVMRNDYKWRASQTLIPVKAAVTWPFVCQSNLYSEHQCGNKMYHVYIHMIIATPLQGTFSTGEVVHTYAEKL